MRANILSQFLTEAVTLSMVGGVIGVALGIVGSAAFTRFRNWPAVVHLDAVIVAFAVPALVGTFFGFYPARKVSRLNPIEALRRE